MMARLQRSVLLVALLLCALPVAAQEVGTVAEMDGTADIGRGGAWMPAAIGAPIQQGDQLRTGKPGRLKVVFQDDSVLSLSEQSLVVVSEQVFDPTISKTRSYFDLVRGKLNSIVSDYYSRPGASYEVKTATAVAGVRGTEFSVSYDPEDEITEVLGFSGKVQVHSLLDPTGPGVIITANEATTVAEGQLPTAPRRYNERFFRQQLEGFSFIGGGRFESVTAGHPLVAGSTVPRPDRAPAVLPNVVASGGVHDASNLIGQSPAVVKAMTGQLGISF
jgi:ferric-dicitrate binding protein FerR (iron transport regulator)